MNNPKRVQYTAFDVSPDISSLCGLGQTKSVNKQQNSRKDWCYDDGDDENNDDDPNACECFVKLNALNIFFGNEFCGCWLHHICVEISGNKRT